MLAPSTAAAAAVEDSAAATPASAAADARIRQHTCFYQRSRRIPKCHPQCSKVQSWPDTSILQVPPHITRPCHPQHLKLKTNLTPSTKKTSSTTLTTPSSRWTLLLSPADKLYRCCRALSAPRFSGPNSQIANPAINPKPKTLALLASPTSTK